MPDTPMRFKQSPVRLHPGEQRTVSLLLDPARVPRIRGDEFDLKGTLALGAGSNGINPPGEPVSLELASYAVTIPAGSFRILKGYFYFKGTIAGARLEVKIKPLGDGRFTIRAIGKRVSLAGTTNPATVELTIGDDAAATTTNPIFG